MKTHYDKEKDLIFKYEELKPKLISWGDFVDNLLLKLLKENEGFSIEKLKIYPNYRIKDNKSLIKRAFYRDLKSSDPLKRIGDKVGTRIVLLTTNDIEDARKIICGHTKFWTTKVTRALDKGIRINPKEFDYRSLHINVIPSEYVKGFEKLSKKERSYYSCEIQIRTLLQHAFAEVAHDTVYKGPFSENNELTRILSKAGALMEVTDEYFCKAFSIMNSNEIYRQNFLRQLMNIGNSLGNFFNDKDIDMELTSNIFEMLDINNVELDSLIEVVEKNKKEITGLLHNVNSYIKNQPIIILVCFFVYSQHYFITERWNLEESILKEIFHRLGFSYEYT